MTVFHITKTIAKCDSEGCMAKDEVEGSLDHFGIKKLRARGWWINRKNKGLCLCPDCGRPVYEKQWQSTRDIIMRDRLSRGGSVGD